MSNSRKRPSPRYRLGWLLIALAFLSACTSFPTSNPEATQTRTAEQAQLTAVSGTIAALQERPGATRPLVGVQTPSATLTPPRGVITPTGTAVRRSPAKSGVPAFSDLVIDETRGRLYGSDKLAGRVIVLGLPNLETVASIDVGQAAQPTGLAFSPDGTELAVALFGAGNVALIDPATLQVTGKLFPKAAQSGATQPWSVLFAKPGKLYRDC